AYPLIGSGYTVFIPTPAIYLLGGLSVNHAEASPVGSTSTFRVVGQLALAGRRPVGTGPLPVSQVDRWEAKFGQHVRTATKDGDPRDPIGGNAEGGESKRMMGSVAGAVVGGGSRLAIGEGGDHQPVPWGSNHVCEVAQARRAAGEPGASAPHFYRSVGTQRRFQSRDIGVLEPGDVLAEQSPGLRLGRLEQQLRRRGHILEPSAGSLQG